MSSACSQLSLFAALGVRRIETIRRCNSDDDVFSDFASLALVFPPIRCWPNTKERNVCVAKLTAFNRIGQCFELSLYDQLRLFCGM